MRQKNCNCCGVAVAQCNTFVSKTINFCITGQCFVCIHFLYSSSLILQIFFFFECCKASVLTERGAVSSAGSLLFLGYLSFPLMGTAGSGSSENVFVFKFRVCTSVSMSVCMCFCVHVCVWDLKVEAAAARLEKA